MKSLLYYLPQFNAKERFFLLGHVLGNPRFTLGSAFKAELSKGMNLSLPEDLFCAMDFHLDWLYAALQLYSDGGERKVRSNSDGTSTPACDENHNPNHNPGEPDAFIALVRPCVGVGGVVRP